MQNGITLIALVISIIVMLILAGVSINAIVGENGILTRTQYASFLNEMSAVEEAVQMWKAGEIIDAGGEDTKAIPANGLCNANDLNSTERLVGEVGYYRNWSMTDTVPTTSILSNADSFNSIFGGELIFYPAGVQDLYYLNNEALGLKENKTYLIDAATGMIYSIGGISLKGVSCYSSNMAKAVMNGDTSMPQFAIAEVSGTGSGEKLAGNTEAEYGFQILADTTNNNVYKLYNNGDLYGKGIKGVGLNTSAEEMEKINAGVFQELMFPGEIIGSAQEVKYNDLIKNGCKIIEVSNTIFILNASGELYAFGNNDQNKLGLTQEEQVEYTGREIVKLNINGQKVKKVFALSQATFVITDEAVPKLYAAGGNSGKYEGMLGLGHSNDITEFQQVNFENPDSIMKMQQGQGDYSSVVVLCSDGRMFCSGYMTYLISGKPKVLTFERILDGVNGENISNDIQDFEAIRGLILLKKDGTVWSCSSNFWHWGYDVNQKGLHQFPTTFSTDVKKMYRVAAYAVLLEKDNGELWFESGGSSFLGAEHAEYCNSTNTIYKFNKINDFLPQDLQNDGIKQIVGVYSRGIAFFTNSGKLYLSGRKDILDMNTVSTVYNDDFVCIDKYNIDSIIDSSENGINYMLKIQLSNESVMAIGSSSLIFRDKVLQSSWSKMNPEGVKIRQMNAQTYNGNYAFIDYNNNLWIAGTSSSRLGVNSYNEIEYPNFIMHPDETIRGKVKDAIILTQGLYVLTTDNVLYATGIVDDNGNNTLGFTETKLELTKLLEGVTSIYGCYDNLFIVSQELYYIGWNYYNVAPNVGTGYINNLSPINLPSGYSVNDIVSMGFGYRTHSYVFLKNGTMQKLFLCGKTGGANNGWSGLPNSVTQFTEIGLDGLVENEYCSKMCYYSSQGGYFVTNLGNLYGFGAYNLLGENSTSAEILAIPKKLGLSDVVDVACGNGWIIAVTSDGKVYGTGSNTYGVLGRWVGSPRGARYRTAFEWVECPDLEI